MGIFILHYIFTQNNYSNEKRRIQNGRNNEQINTHVPPDSLKLWHTISEQTAPRQNMPPTASEHF